VLVGPISGCLTLRASTYSSVGPTDPSAPTPSGIGTSAGGIVFSLFLSRRLSCMTSYFSRFSLSSPCPLAVPLLGLSLLDTQLAIPASGASRHMFPYMAVTRALCACSSAGVRRMRESLKESSSWFRLPSRKADRLVLYVVHSASVMAPLTAAYRGSTSMRGVRGAVGFFALVLPSRPGSVALDMVGVVDTSMSSGRIVPAIGGGGRAQLYAQRGSYGVVEWWSGQGSRVEAGGGPRA
jgi:hypothetical protein